MLKEFKQFLLRGNAIDLAVGVVIGAAFGTVVNSIVKDIFTPLVSTIARIPDLSVLTFSLRGNEFLIGNFLNNLISFVLVGAAIFFFVVKPMNLLVSRTNKNPKSVDPTTKKCPECLSEVPIDAKRCKFCAQPLA